MSTPDALTGALNRRHLASTSKSVSPRDPALQCGCIFVDIDHFKCYNDLHGHQRGDEVLQAHGAFLMRYTRTEESVIRIGGDEFVVILHGADEDETRPSRSACASKRCDRAPVPFSLGWAARAGESVQRLLDRADARD